MLSQTSWEQLRAMKAKGLMSFEVDEEQDSVHVFITDEDGIPSYTFGTFSLEQWDEEQRQADRFRTMARLGEGYVAMGREASIGAPQLAVRPSPARASAPGVRETR